MKKSVLLASLCSCLVMGPGAFRVHAESPSESPVAGPDLPSEKDVTGRVNLAALQGFRPINIQPLPAGQQKVLEAVIINTRGRAQWRQSTADRWQGAKVDDLLKPGAQIRTATNESSVTLRAGFNSTIHVGAMTSVSLPEMVQIGATLRTRAALKRGSVDFKVDRVGLTNDFEVITPTTTLAVQGTGARLVFGALDGIQVFGARTNMLNAVELLYIIRQIRQYLSSNSASSTTNPNPILNAMNRTIGPPAVWARALDSFGELESGWIRDDFLSRELRTQFAIANQAELAELLGEFEPPDPGDPTNVFGTINNQLLFAEFICQFQAELFSHFESDLRADGIFRQGRFNVMSQNINEICQLLGKEPDPLQRIAAEIVQYCGSLNTAANQNRCFEVFGHALETTLNRHGQQFFGG